MVDNIIRDSSGVITGIIGAGGQFISLDTIRQQSAQQTANPIVGTTNPTGAQQPTPQAPQQNPTLTPVTFLHDASGNVVTKPVEQNPVLTPMVFSHDEKGNVVASPATAPKANVGGAPASPNPAITDAGAGIAKPFTSANLPQPQQQVETAPSIFSNPVVKAAESIPVFGNLIRVADIAVTQGLPTVQAITEGVKTVKVQPASMAIPSPSMIQIGVAADVGSAIISRDATKLPFYQTVKDITTPVENQQQIAGISIPPAISQIGTAYESANKELAKYTTDISGLGRTIETAKISETTPQGKAVAAVQGIYAGMAQSPIDIAIGFGAGELFGGLKTAGKVAVASAAESGLPVVSQAGRALSTPLTLDIFKVGEASLGIFVGATAIENIFNKPTAVEMGLQAGKTAAGFAGFGVGYSSVPAFEPSNQFAGREFFSGELGISPLERLQFKTEVTARSVTIGGESGSAYREVGQITLPVRTIEPVIKAEPRFDILSKSGEYAKPIKETLIEQPHSVIGSSSFMQQYPENIAIESGIRIGKDVDVLIKSPSEALASLSKKTGLTTEGAQGVLDVHPIPARYPGLPTSTEIETITPDASSLSMKLFGDPYRNIAIPRGTSEVITPKVYEGKLTYEAAQVQTGRKGAAVAVAIESPMSKGYRAEKDIYDFISAYQAQRAVGISEGMKESAFTKSDAAMKSFMNREFTFGTVKGQVGGEAPVKVVRVGDIVEQMREENVGKLQKLFEGEDIGGKLERASRYESSGSGIVEKSILSGLSEIGSVGGSGFSLLSVIPSEFGSFISRSWASDAIKSAVSPESAPSSPSIPSITKSPPSLPPSTPSIVTSSPPSPPSPPYRSITGSPPSIPPSSPGSPPSPPSSPPSLPPSTPPSFPPYTRSPPSPPSTPPSYPPSYPPPSGGVTTPLPPFLPGPSGGGGAGGVKNPFRRIQHELLYIGPRSYGSTRTIKKKRK